VVAVDVPIDGAAAAAEFLPSFFGIGDADIPSAFGGCYLSADEDIGGYPSEA
jgi:hypothetical protein